MSIMDSCKEIEELKKIVKEQNEQLRLHSVSNSVATEYSEFCVRCDREKLPLLCLEDYIKQYCCLSVLKRVTSSQFFLSKSQTS